MGNTCMVTSGCTYTHKYVYKLIYIHTYTYKENEQRNVKLKIWRSQKLVQIKVELTQFE